MHKYQARISWKRNGATFSDNRYSRSHEWSFDGGVSIPASSSPGIVPLPYSVSEAVDPEEALVASASSCHMLWFLSLAAQRGLVVDSYVDEAIGVMDKDQFGKLAFSRISLRPRVQLSAQTPLAAEELARLHGAAHNECFIANSLKCAVVVEPA